MSVRLLNRAAIAAGVVGVAASAHAGGFATSYLQSTVAASGGSYSGGGFSVALLDGGYARTYDSAPLFHDGTLAFTGLNGAGSAQTMVHSFEGAVQSEFGKLRARITSNTANRIHNPDNPAWIDNPSSGVPDLLSAQSFASFYDDVYIDTSGHVASITVSFRVTGLLGEVAPGALAQIATWRILSSGGSAGIRSFTNLAGDEARMLDEIVSQTFVVSGGRVPLGLGLQTWISSNLMHPGLEDGMTIQLVSDAFHSLEITQIVARNASGNELNIRDMYGVSGTDYMVYVPAPGAAALTLIGAACSLRRRRGTA